MKQHHTPPSRSSESSAEGDKLLAEGKDRRGGRPTPRDHRRRRGTGGATSTAA